MQGRGWFDTAWYREIEFPLDSCWYLDAKIGHCGRTIGFVHLTRRRSARPFTVDDVQSLDRLRPWLAHAFRTPLSDTPLMNGNMFGAAAAPLLIGQMIVTPASKIIFQ
jgi:hypothetical protein